MILAVMLALARLLPIADATSQAAGMPTESERAAQSKAIEALDDAAMDAQFQCPETDPNANVYIWHLALWLHWVKVRHAEWNNSQTLAFRNDLFTKHHCTGQVPK
jgi:hypothetical protein